MKHTLISLLCYVAVGVSASILAPGEWTYEQYATYFAVIGLICVIDVRSYRSGLKRGAEIAGEVLHDLCKEKKVKVVPHADN